MVDKWAGAVRESVEHMPLAVTNQHICFDQSRIMVQMEKDKRLIYGDIEKQVEYEISKGPLMTYLMGEIRSGQRKYSQWWTGLG